MKVNERRPNQIVDVIERLVGRLAGKAVAVLGITFKPGTDDIRDSPAVALIEHLRARRCLVRAFDPLLVKEGAAHSPVPLSSTPETALIGADAAVIATGWPEFCDWEWDRLSRLMRSPVIVDGRGTLRNVRLPSSVRYWSIGRTVE